MRDLRIWSESIFPMLRKLQRWGYLRVETEGLHNIPPRGPLVLVANHGGWAALDGLLIPLALSERVPAGDFPYGVVEDILCRVPLIGPALERMGAVPRSLARDPESIPDCVGNLGVFPEGSEGNCKPFWQAYQMQPWKTGFARLAYARKASIVPIAVIGLEECLPVLWKVRALKPFIGTVMPIPLLPLPMPARCKIVFGRAIDIASFPSAPEEDPDFYRRVARHCQGVLQALIDREAADRPLARFARRVRSVRGPVDPRAEVS
jgi:1-acyl-sn-glycerol-3-phosphate acyltransferase